MTIRLPRRWGMRWCSLDICSLRCSAVLYLEDDQLSFSKETFMKYLLFLGTQFGVFFLQRELCGCRHQEAR